MKLLDFKKILRYFSRDKDWKIIIVLFTIFLIALVFANVYAFQVLEKETSAPKNEVKVEVLREGLLKSSVNSIKEKEERLNQVLLVKPDINDPSL